MKAILRKVGKARFLLPAVIAVVALAEPVQFQCLS